MCIKDSSMNDLEIVQTAGIGIAMGNGIEELKAAADYVTVSYTHLDVYKRQIAGSVVVAGSRGAGNGGSVRNQKQVALEICSENLDFHDLQFFHGFCMGVAVGISGSAADHRIFGNRFF